MSGVRFAGKEKGCGRVSLIFCILCNFLLDYLFLRVYKHFRKQDGRLAQLEEHLVYTERVGSSNLSAPTNKKPPFTGGFLGNGR